MIDIEIMQDASEIIIMTLLKSPTPFRKDYCQTTQICVLSAIGMMMWSFCISLMER